MPARPAQAWQQGMAVLAVRFEVHIPYLSIPSFALDSIFHPVGHPRGGSEAKKITGPNAFFELYSMVFLDFPCRETPKIDKKAALYF